MTNTLNEAGPPVAANADALPAPVTRRIDKESAATGGFLWSIADILRGYFNRGAYQSVILPFTVLRRLDQVLEPTREQVTTVYNQLYGNLDNLYDPLCRASRFKFYNTSAYTFARLLDDPDNLAANLRAYVNGFSENMRDILRKFNFDNTITRLQEAGILYLVTRKFAGVDLHPHRVSNAQMGGVFEYLLFKFNEALDENPGEHYTPREVVDLCTELLLRPVVAAAARGETLPGVHTVYDPCCGTGGMLTVAYDRIKGTTERDGTNPDADVFLFGQELNPQTYAVCKSDMYMKLPHYDTEKAIAFGSVLSADGHPDRRFEFILSNPPYGADWRADEEAVKRDHERGGRFAPGTPRISDGQLLFLLHMVARMRSPADGGGRIAVVMNGSPLFTGDAGSGESEIRRHLLENDLIEAIIALPEQMFYNTGISTYILLLANRRDARRRGTVQLIDGSGFWRQMRKSQGQKRRELGEKDIAAILRLYDTFTDDGAASLLLPTTAFGYRKITVERPLRLRFAVTPERLARLEREGAFAALAESKKKDAGERDRDIRRGRAIQQAVRDALATLPPDRTYSDRAVFLKALDTALARATVLPPADKLDMFEPERLKLPAPVRKAIVSALGERDPAAAICRDKDGAPEPDPDLRDTESVPLGEDVDAYVAREVLPHVPDAWIDRRKRDEKDGGVGVVGYEINFNRYFYEYKAPRPVEAIDAEIRTLEAEILDLLREVAA